MNEKILIIDGHPVYILKMEGFLKGLTYKNIYLATSGEEGIRLARLRKPDLVLLSGMLPDLYSHLVCQKIKESLPNTKIIVQTGLFTDAAQISQFKECGADVILDRKEKDLFPLQQAIAEFLQAHSPAQTS